MTADVNTDTEKLLAEIEARSDGATAGPWTAHKQTQRVLIEDPDTFTIAIVDDAPDVAEVDADFIAHAREDVPALIAALRTALAERDELQQRIDNALACLGDDPRYDWLNEHKIRAALTATETSEQ